MFRFLPPCIAVGVLLSSLNAHATPYASEVTNISGTIQYYLNETPDSVVVTFEDGSHGTLNPATPAVGANSFALGSHTSYKIAVSKVGAGTPVQISTDTNTFCVWGTPRGVDINANPTNGSLFGRIYIDNSGSGSKGRGIYILNSDTTSLAGGTTGLATGVFSPYGSPSSPYRLGIGRDDNNVYVGDLTSGGATVWQFDPNVSAFTNQVLGGLGYTAGTAIGVHGEIFGRPVATGSLATGNLTLFTTDYDMAVDADNANTTLGYNTFSGEYNNINEYLIGGASLPWTNPPNLAINAQIPSIATLDEEVDIGPTTGDIFLANYRNNYGAPNLEIFDPTGTNLLFSSLQNGSDYFNAAGVAYSTYIDGTTPTGTGIPYNAGSFSPFAMKVSPDEKFVACGLINNPIFIMSLTNGIPDPTTLTVIPNYPNTGGYEDLRGLTWDAGDNVYTVSSGQGLLRIFSLGLTTTAVTSNDYTGTNGSFSLATPDISASVTATTPFGSQMGGAFNYASPQPVVFTITLNAPQTGPTTVNFILGGTATNGVNYTTTATNSIVFPAGTTTETVTITPTANPVSGPTLTVTLSLVGGASYSAVAPSAAFAAIANTGPQVLVLSGNNTMYRANSNDFAVFTVTRYGDTNAPTWSVPPTAFTLGGSAVFGTDYTAGPQPVSFTVPATAGTGSAVTVNTGDLAETIEVGLPQIHSAYTGNLSIAISGNTGTSPEGTPFSFTSSTASLVLLDNLNPPETVIWSDPLTNAADSVNWTLAFENTNTLPIVYTNYPNFTASNPDTSTNDDFDVEFGYNISADGITPSLTMQSNGWTTALKMTVNKLAGFIPGSPSGASGGVNVYPNGQKFGGNYAVRFSMNLVEGTFSTTEFNMFGINHYGTNANWFSGDYAYGHGTTNNDGLFYWIDADTDGAGNIAGIAALSGQPLPNTGWATISAASLLPYATIFKSPLVYNASPAGAPSDLAGGTTSTWADIEIKQYNKVVTMSINKTIIFSHINTTIFTNGEPMLGYDDPFASVGADPGAAAYYSNLRVVSLAAPTIISSSLSGSSLIIKFTSPDAEAIPSSFTVGTTTNLVTKYKATAATITQSGDIFTATVPYSSTGSHFYAISQTNDAN